MAHLMLSLLWLSKKYEKKFLSKLHNTYRKHNINIFSHYFERVFGWQQILPLRLVSQMTTISHDDSLLILSHKKHTQKKGELLVHITTVMSHTCKTIKISMLLELEEDTKNYTKGKKINK